MENNSELALRLPRLFAPRLPQFQPPASLFQRVAVATLALGIHFEWALQTALLTPFMSIIGVSHRWVPAMWLFGPLASTVLTPYVRRSSDASTSRYGRRRPYIAGGVLGVSVAMLLLAFSADLGVAAGTAFAKPAKPFQIAVFVCGFFLLDLGNILVQGPSRALLADLARSNPPELRTGNKLLAFFAALGSFLGYLAGFFPDWHTIFRFAQTDTCDVYCANLKSCFIIALGLLVFLSVVVLLCVSEDVSVPPPVDPSEPTLTFPRLSRRMWLLLAVTFLHSLAWYPFIIFNTDWMGTEIFGGSASTNDGLYALGVRVGSLDLMIASFVSVLTILCLGWLARRLGGISRAWGLLNILLFSCLALTFPVTKLAATSQAKGEAWSLGAVAPFAALVIYTVIGAPLAAIYSIPHALASSYAPNSRSGQGMSHGVLNLAIVIPQILVSVFSGGFNSRFGDGSCLPVFMVGAAAAGLSAIIALTVLPSPPPATRVI